eukprot:409532_1
MSSKDIRIRLSPKQKELVRTKLYPALQKKIQELVEVELQQKRPFTYHANIQQNYDPEIQPYNYLVDTLKLYYNNNAHTHALNWVTDNFIQARQKVNSPFAPSTKATTESKFTNDQNNTFQSETIYQYELPEEEQSAKFPDTALHQLSDILPAKAIEQLLRECTSRKIIFSNKNDSYNMNMCLNMYHQMQITDRINQICDKITEATLQSFAAELCNNDKQNLAAQSTICSDSLLVHPELCSGEFRFDAQSMIIFGMKPKNIRKIYSRCKFTI